MPQVREQRWWFAACAAGFAVAAVAGGFLGPAVTIFVVVYLLGALLIRFEGERTPVPIPDAAADMPDADDTGSDVTRISDGDAEAARDDSDDDAPHAGALDADSIPG